MKQFLPITKAEMLSRGIETPDFVYVTGDAYVDHPSFGVSIISRVLEHHGYSVVILSQPDWHSTDAFMSFGRPRLGFLVTGGNIDSMVAHYTAAKKKRSDDAYTAGGRAGKRPDRAVTVYCQKIREAYPDIPIAIGGLEASLRRFVRDGRAFDCGICGCTPRRDSRVADYRNPRHLLSDRAEKHTVRRGRMS